MKEKILNSTLEKIFELSSVDLVAPLSENLDSLTREEIINLYSKSWDLIFNVHNLAFKCKQATNLLKTLNL